MPCRSSVAHEATEKQTPPLAGRRSHLKMFERISKVDIPQNDATRNGPQPIIIAQWELNSRESLRVELHEFKGVQIIGIRKWFPAANGAMAPGKDGINLNLKHLPRLAAAVNDALSKALEDGLITVETGQ
jgi:hypothetical protein